MRAVRLPSGNYRVQIYYRDESGKVHRPSFTAPTKAEALRLALAAEKKKVEHMTVAEAVERYIDIREPVISPSTYRGYEGILRTQIRGSIIVSVFLDDLTQAKVQAWVSELAVSHSAKSVQNSYGLLSASLKTYAPDLVLRIKLPQRRRPKLYTPTTADVNLLLDLSKGTELHKAILLGAVGMMRRGEIAALTAEDLNFKKKTISITKSQVKTEDGTHVIKAPRVSRESYTKSSGLPNIRFHDLRHYAASIAASSSVGASVEAIKARGGWSGDSMMKRVYIN